MEEAATRKAIEAVWRIESARLIGGLVRLVRDVGLAEDLAQEALVTALERWPEMGLPDNPGAWLMATAKNRALDRLRRQRTARSFAPGLAHLLESEWTLAPAVEELFAPNAIKDDSLRMMFSCCHPVLSTEARVALTLRLVGGLTTDEIARGFLVPEPTIAQRIVRAKRTLAEARVRFEAPRGAELAARLPSVLEVVYLIFNEGYAATCGDEWMRTDLCDDALRLGRILVGLVPDAAEVHGLVALMELQASRSRARLGPSGEPILLLEQDRSRWDRLLVHRGLAALARAETLGRPLGPYALQAAIAACHARAATADATDWPRIVALTQSPVVALNRAVAVAMAFGPAAGLELVDEIAGEPALRAYHLVPSVRGDLLAKLGRAEEARHEFERAAQMTQNSRERQLLLARAKATWRA